MRKVLVILFSLIGIFSLGAGCQGQKSSTFPTVTQLPTSTRTAILSVTSTTTATLIPSPTVTFPAPLPYHGTLPSDVEARYGLGGFGSPVLSPDGNYLAVTSGVGIILYRPETLAEISILPEDGQLGPIAWSPDSKKLAIVTASDYVTIWDVEQAKPIQKLAVLNVTCLRWSPDGEKIALADGNLLVEVWDLKSAKLVQSFSGHASQLDTWGKIIEVLWTNENEIVSLDENAQIFLWDTKTGDIIHTLEKTDNDFARRIALSPDKKTLAIASMQSQQILLWDLVARKEQKIIAQMPPFIMEMSWSPNGESIALATQFPSRLVFLDVNSGTFQKEFATNVYSVNSLSWLKNGQELITRNGYHDGDVITLWDIQTGQGIYGVRSLTANRAAWSSNGLIVATSDGRGIALWDIQSGNPRLLPDEIRNGVLDGGPNYEGIFKIAFNPSGNLLAAESGDDSSRIRIWDTTTGVLVDKAWIGPHLDQLAWLSDTQLITQTTGNEISIWEVGNWENRQTIDTSSFDANRLDISSDGKSIAIARGNTIEIRKLENGETLHAWKVDMEPKFGLALSPDTTKIALIGTEELAIYEVTSGKKLNSLKPDEPGFNGLKWSPDSNAIVYLTWTPIAPQTPRSGLTGTGKIYLWHITDDGAVLINTQKNIYLFPDNLCFSPDGRYLALALWQQGLIILQLENL
jgi:WD40 repeat protein